MRLLDTSTSTLTLKEFIAYQIPPYAILSHRWGDEELAFQDLDRIDELIQQKSGYDKVKRFCERAAHDGAELSEAINSMFAWYQKAEICYAYLDDVVQEGCSGIIPDGVGNSEFRLHAELRGSKWFTRGWTLQELIAPRVLLMLNVDWVDIGYKRDLCYILHCITGIDEAMLRGTAKLESFSIAKRMSWAADRQTTRPEDIAYSLMGIFNVNLPLIYGEGDKAFLRLQEEIIRNSDDHSIFAWERDTVSINNPSGILSHAPADFKFSANIVPVKMSGLPFDVTNRGIRLQLNLSRGRAIILPCQDTSRNNWFVTVGVMRKSEESVASYLRQFVRVGPKLSHRQSYWSFSSGFRRGTGDVYVAKV